MKQNTIFAIIYLLFFTVLQSAQALGGRVWVTTDAICTEEITTDYKTDISDTSRLKLIEGPTPGQFGLMATNESVLLRGQTLAPFGPEGTLSLWIRTDTKYQTGINETDKSFKLVDVDGLFAFGFNKTKGTLDFVWKWDRSAGNTQYHDLHILTPQLPAQQWIQFTFRWSSSKGIFNCYLNGTPYRQDEKISGLKPASGQIMTIYASELAFGEIILSDRMFEGRELTGILRSEPIKSLDAGIGVEPLDKLEIEQIQGELVYSNPLREPKHIRGWLTEGDAKLSFDQYGMILASKKPDGPLNEGNIVLWCGDDLPPDFIAKWKFQVLSEYGQAMVLFAAKGQNGKNIFDPSIEDRDGTFSQYLYGDINSYNITYYSNTPFPSRKNCSLWKNTGFYLADYGPAVVENVSNDLYNATLVKIGGKIIMAINNWVIVDFIDDGQRLGPVLDWGKVGFRQMKWTKMRYSDFEIYQIKAPLQKNPPPKTDDNPQGNNAQNN